MLHRISVTVNLNHSCMEYNIFGVFKDICLVRIGAHTMQHIYYPMWGFTVSKI